MTRLDCVRSEEIGKVTQVKRGEKDSGRVARHHRNSSNNSSNINSMKQYTYCLLFCSTASFPSITI